MARLKKVCPACNDQYVRGSLCASGHPPVSPMIAIEKYFLPRPAWDALSEAEKRECTSAGLTYQCDGSVGPLREALRDGYVVLVNAGDAPAALKQFEREPFDDLD